MGAVIRIQEGERLLAEADAVILVPQEAPEYPDRLSGLVSGSGANEKHTYHALSQIALYDFQDRVLQVEEVPEGATLTVRLEDREGTLEAGLLVLRTLDGQIRAVAHRGLNVRSLLVFAHRHCTRWIRLDL